MSTFTEEVALKSVASQRGLGTDKVKILEFTKSPGSAFGDGFACDIWRLDIKATILDDRGQDVEEEDIDYIAKSLPEGDFREAMMKEVGMADVEVWFYAEFCAEINKIRQAANLEPLKCPVSYYADQKTGVIVMENLKSQQFQLVKKTPFGIPTKYVKPLLRELAEFHAINYHYLQQYPGGLKALLEKQPILKPKTFFYFIESFVETNKKSSDQNFESARQVIKSAGLEELSRKVAGQIGGNMATKHNKAALPSDSCKFKTLIHGDFWFNNIMFKFDKDDDIIDHRLIDFQFVMVNTVAVDLQNFLGSSVNMADKPRHLDDWLTTYHGTLTSTLVTLGHPEDLYPFQDFMDDFKAASFHALVMGLMHCPMYLSSCFLAGVDEDSVQVQTQEDVEKIGKEFHEQMLAKVDQVPGLKDRIIALAQDASDIGCI